MSDGTINIANRTGAPSSPTTGRTKIWVDNVTKVPQYTDDNGVTHAFTPKAPPEFVNFPNDTGVTTSSTYEIKQLFPYAGTTIATPVKIEVLVAIAGATGGSIRIFDETNSLTIAEITGFVDSTPTLKDMGVLSNLPANSAILSVQILRTGAGGQAAQVHSVKVSF